MTDPDFETELFSLYGEPSRDVPDGGVTERLLREIDREARLRRWALVSAVAVGAGSALAAVSTFAAPVIGRLAMQTGAPALALWMVVPMVAILLGWATVRVALDS
ncbi:MAG: hypothetical protein BGN86_03215 [Caulobacterales bacterium 68-7]|nr:hypothetical protein [Caulobacterales bacterium]OJU08876.1 MAG: hypothetical protein BGN86_03215 [Caulobacterales bacterium 68-7]